MTDLMLSLAEFAANPDRYTLIDVRDDAEFSERHIPSAINVPLERVQSSLPHIPAGSLPVTVCGKGGGRSAEAAAALRAVGLASATLAVGGRHRLVRQPVTAPGAATLTRSPKAP